MSMITNAHAIHTAVRLMEHRLIESTYGHTSMTEPTKSGIRREGSIPLLVALIGAVGALLALRFVPPATQDLGPSVISMRGHFGEGTTTLLVPPLGTVSAETHVSPVGFSATVTSVDPNALRKAIENPASRAELEDRVQDSLQSAVSRLALQLALGGLAIGAIVAALLPWRRWSTILAGSMGGGLSVGVLLFVAAATYNIDAFEEPRFTGQLQRAPEVIAAVNQTVGGFGELTSRYQEGAVRLADLLALVAEPSLSPQEGSVAVLHVSDIHSNPIGVDVAARLAREFEVDAVLDTGDVTSFGSPIEARIGDLIGRIGVPYLFVPGNHDAPAIRAALTRVDNLILLDGEVATVEDLRILGWADPTFTARGEVDTEVGNQERLEEASLVADAVEAEQPDVLAVHDERLASESVGEVPLVLAGHTHNRNLNEAEGATVMTVGSTGATGLGSFLVEADIPYEAQVLYFRNGLPVAYDYVSLSALGGEFEVERSLLEVGLEGEENG
jgi:predicted phosphodiesterase